MARLTEAQQLNYVRQIAQILNSSDAEAREKFKEKGLNIEGLVDELSSKANTAEKSEGEQKQIQAQSVSATQRASQTRSEAYNSGTNTVSLTEGILGKQHPLVKRMRNIADEMAKEALRGRKRGETGSGG